MLSQRATDRRASRAVLHPRLAASPASDLGPSQEMQKDKEERRGPGAPGHHLNVFRGLWPQPLKPSHPLVFAAPHALPQDF